MTSTTPVFTDPRPALLGAADQAVALVGLVTPDRLGDPTPCSEYDVRHLVGHLVAVLRRIGYVAGGGHAFDVPSIVLDLPDDGWLLAAEANAADLRAAWADDAVLDRVLRLPWGEVSGRGA
ncbi:MAG TPA: TIGR03086 family metal-binding protein, partial [Kineosporiaceae bacterium]|nr:TIGR03086 family metal-binding protein [Kineosporiaceae bacterium]